MTPSRVEVAALRLASGVRISIAQHPSSRSVVLTIDEAEAVYRVLGERTLAAARTLAETGELPTLPPATTTDRFHSLSYLQPKFRAKVETLVARMRELGHDAIVWETFRTRARNRELSARGTGIKPLKDGSIPVGMHELGLAADIISEAKFWDAAPAFWAALGREAKALGLTWGGDWKNAKTGKKGRDKPHVQAVPIGEQNAMRARFKKHGYAGVEK